MVRIVKILLGVLLALSSSTGCSIRRQGASGMTPQTQTTTEHQPTDPSTETVRRYFVQLQEVDAAHFARARSYLTAQETSRREFTGEDGATVRSYFATERESEYGYEVSVSIDLEGNESHRIAIAERVRARDPSFWIDDIEVDASVFARRFRSLTLETNTRLARHLSHEDGSNAGISVVTYAHDATSRYQYIERHELPQRFIGPRPVVIKFMLFSQ